jgi:hypothetical protein
MNLIPQIEDFPDTEPQMSDIRVVVKRLSELHDLAYGGKQHITTAMEWLVTAENQTQFMLMKAIIDMLAHTTMAIMAHNAMGKLFDRLIRDLPPEEHDNVENLFNRAGDKPDIDHLTGESMKLDIEKWLSNLKDDNSPDP